MTGRRVVVAGLGDTGVLTAVRLTKYADVVGISSKPGLVSGQELGARLARPEEWAHDYRVGFDRFRRLDAAQIIQGTLVGLDLAQRSVQVRGADGATTSTAYDVLVISTGVSNGFWRQPHLQTETEIDADLRSAHETLAAARSVIVVGGGAAAVSSAANLAAQWADKQVDLYFPGERPLPHHHPRTWGKLAARLAGLGVVLHPGHRADLPPDLTTDEITHDPVAWSTGQPDSTADAVLWTIGRVRPNTDWLPRGLLDAAGFVRVGPDLRVIGQPGLFAVGDVAATDPLRSSARNRADRLLAHNIRADLQGRSLRTFRPPARRWGSVIGAQADGLEVFAPNGQRFRFPAWSVRRVLQPWIVRRGIYLGIRREG